MTDAGTTCNAERRSARYGERMTARVVSRRKIAGLWQGKGEGAGVSQLHPESGHPREFREAPSRLSASHEPKPDGHPRHGWPIVVDLAAWKWPVILLAFYFAFHSPLQRAASYIPDLIQNITQAQLSVGSTKVEVQIQKPPTRQFCTDPSLGPLPGKWGTTRPALRSRPMGT